MEYALSDVKFHLNPTIPMALILELSVPLHDFFNVGTCYGPGRYLAQLRYCEWFPITETCTYPLQVSCKA